MVRLDINERVATIEAHLSGLTEDFRAAHQHSLDERRELRESIAAIALRLDRQLTFVGGIIFTISAVWAVVVFAKDWIVAHLK